MPKSIRSMDAPPEMMPEFSIPSTCRSSSRILSLLLSFAIVTTWAVPALAFQATPGEIELPTDSSANSTDHVERLFHDKEGVLWVATTRGIERFTPLGRVQLPSVGGVSAEITSPFAEDGDGGMLFLTTKGLFQWKNGSVHPISLDLAPTDAPVAVYRDPRQRIWLGTRTGVYEIQPRKSSVPFLWNGGYQAVLHANVHGAVTAL
jgi:ligand-binding sensor domain-containing protein